MRAFQVQDEGDGYGLVLLEDGQQVGGALLPIDALGDDGAFDLANSLGLAFIKDHGGMGGSIPPIQTDRG